MTTTKGAAVVLGAAICLGLSLSVRAEVVPGDDFNANTETAAATLQRWYNYRGLWTTTRWWNAANCVEALEDAAVADNGQNYLKVPAYTFLLNSQADFLNDFYDDEGWWALAWIRAYDLTGQESFLKMARTIFKDMTGGWNNDCGGGIWWKKNNHYVNAVANELFLLVAIRLHQRAQGDAGPGSDLDWALREWAWFKQSGLINAQNLINDGLDRDCQNNGRTTWTYNQGVILGGLTDLYKSTGDVTCIKQAEAIADAVLHTLVDKNGILREPCETGDCHGADLPQFKGIFIRYLAELYDVTRQPAYFDFLRRNAHSVWFHDRDAADHLGLRWDGPFDRADAGRHSSAMFALSAVAEPMTLHLPFAKGAASADFNHAVGGAVGALAWRCDAANAPRAGFMLSGPYLQSLSVGTHVAHFRLAVDRTGSASAPLVRLDVRENLDGHVLSSRAVPWNSFLKASQSQDFALTFTNATQADPLEFRAYWQAIPNAPALTLSDVTLDGGLNWTAANLTHDVGRLDGLNGWAADPIRDRASGFLTRAAETGELSADDHWATFELKVDNFNRDNSVVATISVVDTASGKIVASRELRRHQFTSVLYQTFELGFKAVAGTRYDARTFWPYAPDAPRLTQRSVVIR